jgi:hypothetical protein
MIYRPAAYVVTFARLYSYAYYFDIEKTIYIVKIDFQPFGDIFRTIWRRFKSKIGKKIANLLLWTSYPFVSGIKWLKITYCYFTWPEWVTFSRQYSYVITHSLRWRSMRKTQISRAHTYLRGVVAPSRPWLYDWTERDRARKRVWCTLQKVGG